VPVFFSGFANLALGYVLGESSMVVIGFVTKATHLAVYDAPVGTYEKLSFSVHNFGKRWLGVTTRAKAAVPHASYVRCVWQQRLQIKGDSFVMINDWDDLGYDDGTLPTQSMPAIL
jgi:hypothetical protein